MAALLPLPGIECAEETTRQTPEPPSRDEDPLRTPLKITLWTSGAVVALPVVGLTTTWIVNAVATRIHLAAITTYG